MGQVCATTNEEGLITRKSEFHDENPTNMDEGEDSYVVVMSRSQLENDTATTLFKEGEKSEVLSEVISEDVKNDEGVLVTINRWGQVVKAQPCTRMRVNTRECIE